MEKKLLRFLYLGLAVIMICSIPFPATADEMESEVTIEEILQNASPDSITTTSEGICITTVVVNDPIVIAGLVNSGDAALGPDGSLPTSVTIYRYTYPITATDTQIDIAEMPVNKKVGIYAAIFEPIYVKDISIQKGPQLSKCGDNYIEEHWICDGDTLTRTFSGSAAVEWSTSMSGSLEIGGDIVSVVDLKGAVSKELGASIGVTLSYATAHTSTAPAGILRCIRSWMNYTGFEYSAFYGTTRFASGDAYRPCGVIVLHCDYVYNPEDYFD